MSYKVHLKTDKKDSFELTLCGAGSSFVSRPDVTDDISKVTCKRCLEVGWKWKTPQEKRKILQQRWKM